MYERFCREIERIQQVFIGPDYYAVQMRLTMS